MIRMFRQEDSHLLKRTWKYIYPYKIKFILGLLCILSGIGTSLAVPIFWGRIINNLFQKNMDGAVLNIIYSLILGILNSIMTYFQSYIFASLNQDIIFFLKRDMYKSMLDLPIKAYDDIDNGEFMSRLHGDAVRVANAITDTLLNSIVDVIRIVAIGITIFAISVKLSLIILIAFPISFYISNKYAKKIRSNNRKYSELNDKYFSNTGEAIWGIREIKSLGIKNNKFDSFIKLTSGLRERLVTIAVLSSMSQLLSNSIDVISQMAVVFVGGIYVLNGSLNIQYFIAFYSYTGQFSSSLLNISRINFNLQQVMNSLERIFFLIDGLFYSSEKFGKKSIGNINGNIKFDNVFFQYNKGKNVLDSVTVDIPAGSRTAIVGSSGSGKTTMFNLILKLYEPCKGKILIDGIDLNEISEEQLRRHISVVRQEPFLFSMSIRENLLLANAEANQQELESACRQAYIYDFIDSLPEKYDSILGENGVNLSGGQKQRIAIARALLKKSKIILLDEATSSLDNESQFYIKKAVDSISRDCTVVIIAHRLSTVIESDVIYVLDKGKIVGQGNHQSLIRINSIYKSLYKAEVDIINENCKEVI